MDDANKRSPGKAPAAAPEWRSGDVETFGRWCTTVEGPLHSYAFRMVKDHAEAQDIVQETLLRLFRMDLEGRLRAHTGPPRSLAFSIAHNLAMDWHRRRSRTAPPPRQGPSASPEEKTERAMVRAEIDRALAQLPVAQRSALLLKEFGGLSYAEIAETLGTSALNVKALMYRARKRLATLLDRDGQYVGDSKQGGNRPGGMSDG